LTNTVIAYTTNLHDLWCYANANETDLASTGSALIQACACTADGRIGFVGFDPKNISNAIMLCNYDGTGLTVLLDTSLINVDCIPAFSPDGTKYAFVDKNGDLQVGKMNGSGGLTQIETGGEFYGGAAFSPDSSKIAYVGRVASYDEIFVAPVSGGTPNQLTNTNYFTGNFDYPNWSPDGNWIACSAYNSSTGSQIALVEADDGYVLTLQPPSGCNDYLPAFSPDGSAIAFVREPSSGPLYLETENVTGQNAIQLAVDNGTSTSWSPFFPAKQFLGTKGNMGSAGQGFIWSQSGSQFGSLVTYTANGASTVANVGQSDDKGDLVFDIHASDVTGLQYSNGYFDAPTSLTNSGTDVLVTIGNDAGLVQTVAPFVTVRGGVKPSVIRQGATTVYQGRFTGFWTREGKNIAPNGAAEVVLNSKTGAVVSIK
jgi:Tol biopolymer transport system component